MVIKSVRSVRKGEEDYGGKDLWRRLSFESGVEGEGVMHNESGDNDDELM